MTHPNTNFTPKYELHNNMGTPMNSHLNGQTYMNNSKYAYDGVTIYDIPDTTVPYGITVFAMFNNTDLSRLVSRSGLVN